LVRSIAAVQFLSDDGLISESLFEGNSALCGGFDCRIEGGALRNIGRLKVEKSRFVANRTEGDGGAIFNEAGATLALEEVVIERVAIDLAPRLFPWAVAWVVE
jgi:hypothetical protein